MTTISIRCQQLKLANDLFPLFRSGDKRVTCRKGHRDIQLGDLLFISTDAVQQNDKWDLYYEERDEFFLAEAVEVDRVTYTCACDLLIEEVEEAGFMSIWELVEGMQRFYPDFNKDTEVTLIYFETI